MAPQNFNLRLSKPQHHSLTQLANHASSAVNLAVRSLLVRDGVVDCDGKDKNRSVCETPASRDHTQTLAIALGAAIPLGAALIVLFFLHRRMKKNQRAEDNDAKHRSLDFGMDIGPASGKKGRKVPEMTVTDLGDPMRSNRNIRGLSMDMDMSNPYLLPAGLQGSNASIHSMSRKISDEHDPYRPVTFIKSDAESMRSGRRMMGDNSSMYSASTAGVSSERAGLIPNASRMSMSIPPSRAGMSPTSPQEAKPYDEGFQTRQMHSSNNRSPPQSSSRKQSLSGAERPSLNNISENAPRKDLPASPPVPEPALQMPPPRTSSAGPQRPLRKDSMPGVPSSISNGRASSNYGDDIRITSATPEPHEIISQTITVNPSADVSVPTLHAPKPTNPARASLIAPNPNQNPNRVSVIGLRPLPPDVPDDNPEQRANRIRSFYKEYFDDSKPNQTQQYSAYHEDYDPDYLRDMSIYDPETNGFITGGANTRGPAKPWAQPMTRRAMTPPPRGAPRVSGGKTRARHNSTQSAAGRPNFPPPGSRSGTPRGRPLPPPAPLQSLPTPHKLGIDAHIINPIDFAPPSTFRDQGYGRGSDSPTGVSRPYSPSVAPHVPLARSYDELAPIPSPYLLRKSGTFTSLDFAPPSKFKNEGMGSGSDAGSIRSNRSGISAVQRDAVKAGAYRVSRIPMDVVGMKGDLSQQLRPTWDVREKGLLGVGGGMVS